MAFKLRFQHIIRTMRQEKYSWDKIQNTFSQACNEVSSLDNNNRKIPNQIDLEDSIKEISVNPN